jgi:hypothetical protein
MKTKGVSHGAPCLREDDTQQALGLTASVIMLLYHCWFDEILAIGHWPIPNIQF